MNQLDKDLTKLISDLLPEARLMELALGTRYLYNNELRTFLDSDHYKNAEVVIREKIDVPNIEILGKEPQLHHVLMALGKGADPNSELLEGKYWFAADDTGEFMLVGASEFKRTGKYWDLEDGLSGTSDRTREWLLQLLTPTE